MSELLGLATKAATALAKAMLSLIAGSSVGAKSQTPAKPIPKPKPAVQRPVPKAVKSKHIILVGQAQRYIIILRDPAQYRG